MTGTTATRTRIGLATLVAAIVTAATCSSAVARVHKTHHHWHAHGALYESRAQLAPQAPVRLAPMRYYGGPKSPMWRGPAGY